MVGERASGLPVAIVKIRTARHRRTQEHTRSVLPASPEDCAKGTAVRIQSSWSTRRVARPFGDSGGFRLTGLPPGRPPSNTPLADAASRGTIAHMVDHQFKVGDTVTWKPEHYEYRDQHKCPHTFVVSKISLGNRDYPWTLVFWDTDDDHCPAAKMDWVQSEEGPW